MSLSTFRIVDSIFFFHKNMWFSTRQPRILRKSICHLYLKYYLHGTAEKQEDTQPTASLDT